MHSRKLRILALTSIELALLSSMTPTPANAAVATIDCGIVTCSAYLTRNTTKQICNKLCQYSNSSTAVIAGAAALACAPIGGVGAIVCGAAGAVYGAFFIDKLQQATNKNQCLRIRFIPGVSSVTGLYSDGSKYCKN